MRRIIGEIQPSHVFVENSPMLTLRGLGVVLGDLAALGYDAVWGVLGAVDAGAPHERERIWIMGHAMQGRRSPASIQQDGGVSRKRAEAFASASARAIDESVCGWWKAESGVGRVVDGMADDMDRIAALGNGQVPAVAALAWQTLERGFGV
jgi:DNA (cytosine-5)-methyltransferase 1